MKKDNSNKIKLVKLLEILRQDSDEDNPISTNELIRKLENQGITCRRETLYEDIKTLNDFGYEVLCQRGVNNGYFIVDRSFDLPELRILIDAVQASSFITPKKSSELIDKVAELGGSHRGELLKNDSMLYNTTKHTNEHIYYNINEIEMAINQGKEILFRYFDYNAEMKKIYRKEGKIYNISPYSMIINNDNYYLIGYNEKHNKMLHFRIDRMTDVELSEKDIVKTDCIKQFDIKKHHKELFGMYGGEPIKVKIEFDESLIDVVVDKFGEDVKFTHTKENMVSLYAMVQVSPQFFAWVSSFGNKMKILSPNKIVDKVKTYLKIALENYD